MLFVARDPDKGYIDTQFWVPKKHVNEESIKNALTFTFSDKAARTRTVCLWQETKYHIKVPREFWNPKEMAFETVDCRPTSYPTTTVTSRIELDVRTPGETVQHDALNSLLTARGGILQLACGRGKTVIALELIARLRVPAIIVVDNTQLLHQWRDEINRHLNVPGGVGLIQGNKFDWEKDVVLATYQTLANKADVMPTEVRERFGVVIWDEAHHVSAPVFSRSADLFAGRRYGLTATPNRADGTQVVYEFHNGPVLYKNLTQKLRPTILFLWTGLEVNPDDPNVARQVLDKNNELHLSKLARYFGQWRPRLDLLLHYIRDAASQGRKILVLSNSIDELANLYALWTGESTLYTDIPTPTAQEAGIKVDPVMLPPDQVKSVHTRIRSFKALLKRIPDVASQNETKRSIDRLNLKLEQHEAAKQVQAELERRQRSYIERVTNDPKAGLLIYKVPPAKRQWMLKHMPVTFSIMKYGREGLDERSLDTVFVCEPMSQKNGLQQMMGRALREMNGKKEPIIMFFEDNIRPMRGMCHQLRRHLSTWPVEEGGPYRYSLLGYPETKARNPRTLDLWASQ